MGPPIRAAVARLLGVGVAYADDDDEALRVRVLNICAALTLAVQGTITGGAVLRGDVHHSLVTAPIVLVPVVVFLLHRRGRLSAARWLTLIAIPLIYLTLVALGGARRGSASVLVITPLLPLALLHRPKVRAWFPASVVLAGVGGVATYVGFRWPVFPDLPPDRVAAINAATIAASAVAITALAWIMVWRQGRILDALRDALMASVRGTETREVLLSTVSHELRTPAAVAQNLLEQLADEDLPPKARRILGDARAALSAEIDMLGDLIDVVSLRSRDLPLRPRTFHLPEVLRRATAHAQALAQERDLAFDVQVDDGLGWRLGDPDRLAQAVRHLCHNAVRFTRVGGVRVKAAAGAGDAVELSVSDSGVGMSEAEQRRVFDAFEQGTAGHARAHGGLGLGLTLVRALVQRMQGNLHIEAAAGAGSRFTVTVSLPQAEAEALDPNYLKGRRVLVVDDLEVNRRILAGLVKRMGAEAFEAADGEEAVEKWRTLGPHVVLMDMQMPVVDGLEATRRIRRAGGTVPIIAVTANATPGAEQACRSAGMDGYLTKPIRREDLLRALAGAGPLPPLPDPLPWTSVTVASPDASVDLPRG